METKYLKVVLLILMSGAFVSGAGYCYLTYPEEVSLWAPLSFFGTLSLIFTLVLLAQLLLDRRSAHWDELDGEEE